MDLEARERLLRSAGLKILDMAWSGPVPEPSNAWKLIIAGGVTPSAAVQALDGNRHLDEVETKWESIAEDCGLFGGRGEFLIHLAGVGAAMHPWACVQRNSGLSLAHHLAPHAGEPEFVAMSIDGRVVCGVTTEEYDVWVVCKGFT
jgi:hypothetical protein